MTFHTDNSSSANSEYRLGILLLAAGASRRFDGIKQLAQLETGPLQEESIQEESLQKASSEKEPSRKQSMLHLALQQVSQLPAVKRVVALGANKDVILSTIKLPDNVSATMVENWQEGIAASIRSGVGALEPENLSHLFIVLGDQPALSITDYNQLIALSCNNLQNIICAHYGKKNAVPAIFPASCFSLLAELKGDKGAGKALNSEALRKDIISLDMSLGEKDIDTRADLMQFQQKNN